MEKIAKFISDLIQETDPLLGLSSVRYENGERSEYIQRVSRWLRSIQQILTYGELNDFLKAINDIIDKYPLHVTSDEIAYVAGVLQSAHECMTGGFVGKLKYLIHAEMFDSLLWQAESLLDNGHKITSAVLGRIVIERWLRDQSEKSGISNWETEKASVLNDGLKKNGVYSTPKWRQIQSYLDIGNSAAHGKDSEFSETDVRLLIGFAKANCS
jgi:hypothetical protein